MGVERDLSKIADSMLEWEEKLSTHLLLTPVDISDIKDMHIQKPVLQSYIEIQQGKILKGVDTFGAEKT